MTTKMTQLLVTFRQKLNIKKEPNPVTKISGMQQETFPVVTVIVDVFGGREKDVEVR